MTVGVTGFVYGIYFIPELYLFSLGSTTQLIIFWPHASRRSVVSSSVQSADFTWHFSCLFGLSRLQSHSDWVQVVLGIGERDGMGLEFLGRSRYDDLA